MVFPFLGASPYGFFFLANRVVRCLMWMFSTPKREVEISNPLKVKE